MEMVVEVKGVVAAAVKGVVAMAVVVKAMEARKASWQVVMAVVAVVARLLLLLAVAVAVALLTVPVMVLAIIKAVPAREEVALAAAKAQTGRADFLSPVAIAAC